MFWGTVKKQWVGMDDSPLIETASFRTRVLKMLVWVHTYITTRMVIRSDRVGKLPFAYHIPLTQNYGYFMKDRELQRQLSFGLSAVINHYGFDDAVFNEENTIDPYHCQWRQGQGHLFQCQCGYLFPLRPFLLQVSPLPTFCQLNLTSWARMNPYVP